MKITDRAVALIAVLVVVVGVMLFEEAKINADREAWSQSAIRALAAATCDALKAGNTAATEIGEAHAASELLTRLTQVQNDFEGNDYVRVFIGECRKRLGDVNSGEQH